MNAVTQRRLRRLHSWLGLFFAPSILFFALTGTMQALGFQDRSAGYRPPAWIALVTNVHKHGEARAGRKHRETKPATAAAGTPARPAPADEPAPAPHPFSLFAALLGIVLALATGLGIAIGLTSHRDRKTALLLVAAGIVVPLALLLG